MEEEGGPVRSSTSAGVGKKRGALKQKQGDTRKGGLRTEKKTSANRPANRAQKTWKGNKKRERQRADEERSTITELIRTLLVGRAGGPERGAIGNRMLKTRVGKSEPLLDFRRTYVNGDKNGDGRDRGREVDHQVLTRRISSTRAVIRSIPNKIKRSQQQSEAIGSDEKRSFQTRDGRMIELPRMWSWKKHTSCGS